MWMRVAALAMSWCARTARRRAASTKNLRSLDATLFAWAVILAGPSRLLSPRPIAHGLLDRAGCRHCDCGTVRGAGVCHATEVDDAEAAKELLTPASRSYSRRSDAPRAARPARRKSDGCRGRPPFVRGTDGRECSMWAFAPISSTLRVGSCPKAAFSPAADTAGIFFNCARAGTTCGDNASSFTIHELESNPSGVVTRLRMREQTCLGGFPPLLDSLGRARVSAGSSTALRPSCKRPHCKPCCSPGVRSHEMRSPQGRSNRCAADRHCGVHRYVTGLSQLGRPPRAGRRAGSRLTSAIRSAGSRTSTP